MAKKTFFYQTTHAYIHFLNLLTLHALTHIVLRVDRIREDLHNQVRLMILLNPEYVSRITQRIKLRGFKTTN